jgi:hypothetical protein
MRKIFAVVAFLLWSALIVFVSLIVQVFYAPSVHEQSLSVNKCFVHFGIFEDKDRERFNRIYFEKDGRGITVSLESAEKSLHCVVSDPWSLGSSGIRYALQSSR